MESSQNQNKLAPICLFTYNRLSETQQTVEALKKNYLAPESELFIFSDGPKDNSGAQKVNEVRKYLKTIDGFKTITIYESQKNKGLANSIISGVTQIIEQYGKIIVLEDDLITSSNFLDYMNQALDFYENHPNIHSVSGYTLDLPYLREYSKDYYFGYRASSLGWGSWLSKWVDIDWNVSDYKIFRHSFKAKYAFFKIGSDMPRMLKRQQEGKIDSWAIRWGYHQFKKGYFTVFASKSKVNHIGISNDATHAVGAKKFDTPLDSGIKQNFHFSNEIQINRKLIRQFKNKFSLIKRALDKIKRITTQ